MNIIIRSNYILPFVLFISMLVLLILLIITEMGIMERVCLPFLITFFIGTCIYSLLHTICKDKFISKIYLISILMHYVFILFWEFLKYHLMGIHLPTDNTYIPFIIDNDGVNYHAEGVYLNNHFNFEHFQGNMYGGLFPRIIGVVYHYFGNNPFLISCINTTLAGFSATLYYLIGKATLPNIDIAKIFALFSIANFSHIMNTSTLMRDNYIVLLIYCAIVASYYFYKSKNILYIFLTLLSLYGLYLFRPYAAYIIFAAIAIGYAVQNIRIRRKKNSISMNKIAIALIVLSPLLLVLLAFLFNMLTHSFGTILSVEDVIAIRESAYVGSNTDYSWDFGKLYGIFPLLPFIVGYICLFFAPFPWEWVLVRRMVYVPDMLILYCFLPSFIKNLKLAIFGKQYYLTVFFFSMLIMFTIYSITLGNSGSIQRLRGPYISMIYLIAMYRPDKFLSRILNKIQQWRIV